MRLGKLIILGFVVVLLAGAPTFAHDGGDVGHQEDAEGETVIKVGQKGKGRNFALTDSIAKLKETLGMEEGGSFHKSYEAQISQAIPNQPQGLRKLQDLLDSVLPGEPQTTDELYLENRNEKLSTLLSVYREGNQNAPLRELLRARALGTADVVRELIQSSDNCASFPCIAYRSEFDRRVKRFLESPFQGRLEKEPTSGNFFATLGGLVESPQWVGEMLKDPTATLTLVSPSALTKEQQDSYRKLLPERLREKIQFFPLNFDQIPQTLSSLYGITPNRDLELWITDYQAPKVLSSDGKSVLLNPLYLDIHGRRNEDAFTALVQSKAEKLSVIDLPLVLEVGNLIAFKDNNGVHRVITSERTLRLNSALHDEETIRRIFRKVLGEPVFIPTTSANGGHVDFDVRSVDKGGRDVLLVGEIPERYLQKYSRIGLNTAPGRRAQAVYEEITSRLASYAEILRVPVIPPENERFNYPVLNFIVSDNGQRVLFPKYESSPLAGTHEKDAKRVLLQVFNKVEASPSWLNQKGARPRCLFTQFRKPEEQKRLPTLSIREIRKVSPVTDASEPKQSGIAPTSVEILPVPAAPRKWSELGTSWLNHDRPLPTLQERLPASP